MLTVHRSNRAERLVEMLGDVLSERPAGPFEQEHVIVQGRGMERWLSMQLAQRFGVWANPSFPFPRRFLLDLFRQADPAPVAGEGFEPEILAWAIAAELPAMLAQAEMAPVRAYLGADWDEGRLLSLSQRIARTFDDYVVFRPAMVTAWERGGDGGWEAALWRRLVEKLGARHVANRAQALLARLDAATVEGDALRIPARLCVFGVSTLAPLYLSIVARLAERSDVHLFVLSPSQEYWSGLRARRDVVIDLARMSPAEDLADGDVIEREVGNRLLASLGRIGGEFQALLEAAGDFAEEDAFDDPQVAGETSVLPVLQSDMLHLRYRGAVVERLPYSADDPSFEVHSCHGPMREVQVLHDRLRAMFDRDPSLRPRDVIVMTPDIDGLAPYVEAVFDSGEGDRSIPFRIADRSPDATSEVFDAFTEIVGLLAGRVTSAGVADLLRLQVVRARFGFDDAEVTLVRDWIDGSEIRWGIDAEDRAARGHPAVDQNTWQFGLRRLFLGYAIGDAEADADVPYAPYDDLEGGDGATLGKLAELCRRLFAHAARLQGPLAVSEWPELVAAITDDLIWNEGYAAFQVQSLRAAATVISARAAAAGYQGSADSATMVRMIGDELRLYAPARGFLSGEVTFCELVPMRTIPFRVVCLVGMNDGAFPRNERRPDFDRIGQRRCWGDRSLRDDDRYMFLEALLSARETFYVSYVGQDAQSNTEAPPSVVVQELVDAVLESFSGVDADSLVARHPMQSFNRRYFTAADDGPDRHLVSYSKSAYQGALALASPRTAAGAFVTAAAAAAEPVLAVDDLVAFFEHPTRTYLQRRLRLYLGGDLGALETREPLDLDALERWKLGDAMLNRALGGQVVDFASVARLGSLPVGSLGEIVYEQIESAVSQIATVGRGAESRLVAIDRPLAGFRVSGTIETVDDHQQRWSQYSKLGGRLELALWIRHLLLCHELPEAAIRSHLVGRLAKGAGMITFEPCAAAEQILEGLVSLYAEGMRLPLPLFRNASRAFVEKLAKTGSADGARRAAERGFRGDAFDDSSDPYVRQVYGERNPFSAGDPAADDAARIARIVYEPLLAARNEEQL